MQVQSLGCEDPLEEGMATHSSILAWRIPWTEEPGGLQCEALQKSWMWLKRLSTYAHKTWRRVMPLIRRGKTKEVNKRICPIWVVVCRQLSSSWVVSDGYLFLSSLCLPYFGDFIEWRLFIKPGPSNIPPLSIQNYVPKPVLSFLWP